jgi:hypothetical protein
LCQFFLEELEVGAGEILLVDFGGPEFLKR